MPLMNIKMWCMMKNICTYCCWSNSNYTDTTLGNYDFNINLYLDCLYYFDAKCELKCPVNVLYFKNFCPVKCSVFFSYSATITDVI